VVKPGHFERGARTPRLLPIVQLIITLPKGKVLL
jgi:hypothetical protein